MRDLQMDIYATSQSDEPDITPLIGKYTERELLELLVKNESFIGFLMDGLHGYGYLMNIVDRLRRYEARGLMTEALREKIFARDGLKCRDCQSTDDLQIDHIIPVSKGGRTEETNLQVLCRSCNIKKGDSSEVKGYQ